MAAPANALWLVGSIWLAIAVFRARALPPGLALAGILVQPTYIFSSQSGGSVLTAAYLVALGLWLMRR